MFYSCTLSISPPPFSPSTPGSFCSTEYLTWWSVQKKKKKKPTRRPQTHKTTWDITFCLASLPGIAIQAQHFLCSLSVSIISWPESQHQHLAKHFHVLREIEADSPEPFTVYSQVIDNDWHGWKDPSLWWHGVLSGFLLFIVVDKSLHWSVYFNVDKNRTHFISLFSGLLRISTVNILWKTYICEQYPFVQTHKTY